jgi:sodium/proline symporter
MAQHGLQRSDVAGSPAWLLQQKKHSAGIVENASTIIGTFVVYVAVILLMAYVVCRCTTNLSDFVLGGRSLNRWVMALSAQATDMSSWRLMGLSGFAYLAGFEAGWMVIGLLLGAHLNWKLFAQRLRVVTEKFSDAPTRIAKREAPRERHVSMSANTR